MVMIQIDLNERENKIVELFKAIRGWNTKEEAIKEMIEAASDIVEEETSEFHKHKK